MIALSATGGVAVGELSEQAPADIHAEVIRAGIEKAKTGDFEAGLTGEVFAALAGLQTNPDTLGLYLTLLTQLVGAHKSIRKGDIEKAVRALLPEDEKDTSGRISAADEIVALVTESCTLFTDQEDQSYAIFEQDGHREVWPINSTTFKDWVSMLLYRTVGKTPRAPTLADAFSTLNGIARHDGERHDVHLRVATDGAGGYYLDICDDQWRVVHITARGWQIINESPVMFRRSKASKAIPIPITGGMLADLKALVNVHQNDDLLLVTALLDCIRPDTADPVIELIGEQGSGKSTTAENKRRLIDPHSVNLRSAPKTVEDIFVSARNNHFVCFNNMSRLSADEQDALCNLSTGGGYASRRLYTNDEEITYEAKRPVLINGINAVATQPDLVSRLVRLECPTLEGSDRRLDDRELAEVFDKRSPLAMGFLLDTMASALAVLPDIVLTEKPRMMDFARLGAAVGQVLEPVNGQQAFESRYRDARDAASMQALDSMPVITSLIDYLLIHAPYIGNYTGLLKEIEEKVGKTADAGWPKSAKGLASAIGRAKPILNLLGWEVVPTERDKHGARVTLRKKTELVKINKPESISTNSTNSTEAANGAVGVHGADESRQNYYQSSGKKSTFDVQTSAPVSAGGIL